MNKFTSHKAKLLYSTLTFHRPGPRCKVVQQKESFQETECPISQSFESARGKLLNNLTTALENRFGDLDSGVMQASLIVDFIMWPDKENSNLCLER